MVVIEVEDHMKKTIIRTKLGRYETKQDPHEVSTQHLKIAAFVFCILIMVDLSGSSTYLIFKK